MAAGHADDSKDTAEEDGDGNYADDAKCEGRRCGERNREAEEQFLLFFPKIVREYIMDGALNEINNIRYCTFRESLCLAFL